MHSAQLKISGCLSAKFAENSAPRLVPLTAREWALFEALLGHPGQLFSKAQLEDKLYAFGAEVESNTIEVHVSRLRGIQRSAIERRVRHLAHLGRW